MQLWMLILQGYAAAPYTSVFFPAVNGIVFEYLLTEVLFFFYFNSIQSILSILFNHFINFISARKWSFRRAFVRWSFWPLRIHRTGLSTPSPSGFSTPRVFTRLPDHLTVLYTRTSNDSLSRVRCAWRRAVPQVRAQCAGVCALGRIGERLAGGHWRLARCAGGSRRVRVAHRRARRWLDCQFQIIS